MQKYETLVVFQPNLSEEQLNTLIERVSDIIGEDATLESIDNWGLRKLAYEIDKQYNEGYYVIFNFEAEPSTSVLKELEHNYRIMDDVIRSIVVKRKGN